jgi:hypothetical protein
MCTNMFFMSEVWKNLLYFGFIIDMGCEVMFETHEC